MAVHIKSPVGVAFTSSDVYQLYRGELVSSSYFSAFGRFPGDTSKLELQTLPQYDEIEEIVSEKVEEARLVDRRCLHWVWSPGSGNVYRRDAIAMFVQCEAAAEWRVCADAFINTGLNCLYGSIIIDKPLGVYRIHDSNNFSKGVMMQGALSYKRETNPASKAASIALSHLIKNIGRFYETTDTRDLLQAMSTLRRKASAPSVFAEKLIVLAATVYFRFALRRGRRGKQTDAALARFLDIT